MMTVMMIMMNFVQVCASVPMLLSTLADYISSVGDVIVLLYVHSAFYADVINSWLLTNVLVYVFSAAAAAVWITACTSCCM